MTKQNASEPNSTLNNPLMPVVTPGSQQETQLRQVFVLSISLGIVELLVSGLALLGWLNLPGFLDTIINTGEMPAEQIDMAIKLRDAMNQMPRVFIHGITSAFILFGLIPGLLYLCLASRARRYVTAAVITLMVLAVMQCFVSGVLLIQCLSLLAMEPCGMMFYVVLFGTLALTTGSLAWKLFQLRQFQMRHLLALQQGVNAQYRQAQANQVSKMAQDHHENTKHELKRPVEPWDES